MMSFDIFGLSFGKEKKNKKNKQHMMSFDGCGLLEVELIDEIMIISGLVQQAILQ